jgi:hypothetical protein
MHLTTRAICLVLGTFAAALLLEPASSLAGPLDGIGNIGDGGGTSSVQKYPNILQTYRGLNFGGPTFPYVHAEGGADSASVLEPGGQVDDLVAQVTAGDVTMALMWIGDNDWFDVAAGVATGAISGAALTSFQTTLVNNITSGVDAVRAAGGNVVLGGFSDIVAAPAAAAIYANPVWRANLENAMSTADDMLIDYANANGIPFIDFFGLEKMVYDSGSFVVGGVDISLTTVGPDPHNFFQDGENAGAVIRGVIANLWIQALNEGYGAGIPLLSDLEILTLAGIGDEFVEETFVPQTAFGDFVEYVPEPSTVVLCALGMSVVALVGARHRRRR